jgi:DNA-binding response OmpR family regulator
MNRTTVIICDKDRDVLDKLQKGLVSDEFDVETITDATNLETLAIQRQPSIVIVSPEVHAFNEYDVCKKLMKDRNIPVLLLVNDNSTHRANIDECRADDVLIKPVKLDNLLNLIHKHMSVHQSH